MPITQDVQDIDNYPGTIKRVTIDTDVIVPTGAEGDEKMMLTASTSGYSDNEARTSIQSLYVYGSKVGWVKSNGLAGSAGKFNITSSANRVGICMDATVSGTFVDGTRGCYELELAYNDTTLIRGEDIAADLQSKIRAVECVDADAGFQLAYTNASVKYIANKFIISSGSISNSYTGDDRSSVYIATTASGSCVDTLGLENAVSSEMVAGWSTTEAYLTADYTGGTTPLSIGTGTGVAEGDALMISDGTNTEYFVAMGVSGGDITVDTSGANGIANSYTMADGAYIQILRRQDPDVKPNSYFEDIDGLMRYMAKIMVNQLDFSS